MNWPHPDPDPALPPPDVPAPARGAQPHEPVAKFGQLQWGTEHRGLAAPDARVVLRARAGGPGQGCMYVKLCLSGGGGACA